MKIINVGCDLSYQLDIATSFLFQFAVSETPYQSILNETIQITPNADLEVCHTGLLGNRMHRLQAQPCEFTVAYRATVELDQAIAKPTDLIEMNHSSLPPEVLPFLNPSRYCESDRLVDFAWQEFGNIRSGHARAQSIADWVHAHLNYTPGSTNASSTACDVLIQRTGVCRDYAHLAISFCRALGIPARYVAGYAVNLQPPDFHGFYEVYLSDSWYLFDATNLAPVSGFVRIGAGRDAADMSFATIIGGATSTQVSVWAFDNDSDNLENNQIPIGNEAISSA